jgi:hypothetical protein
VFATRLTGLECDQRRIVAPQIADLRRLVERYYEELSINQDLGIGMMLCYRAATRLRDSSQVRTRLASAIRVYLP